MKPSCKDPKKPKGGGKKPVGGVKKPQIKYPESGKFPDSGGK